MGESTRFSRALDDSKAVELTGKIMVVAIIVFFVVVVFVIFLHLYAKWFWWRLEEDDGAEAGPSRRTRRRRRFVFAPGQDPAVAALRRGLEPAVLRSLPVLVYRAGDFKDGLECAVCLSELANGEKARLLPKCNHGFHVDCIDMWFQSHSTCPLCRSSVAPENSPAAAPAEPDESISSPESSMEFPNFPTNVLFWGNQTQVSSGNACLEEEEGGSSQASTTAVPSSSLVIDIPTENSASSSSSSSSMLSPPGEDLKSPVTTRLRSLKRLLSRERRVSPCTPNSGGDIEQASRGQS